LDFWLSHSGVKAQIFLWLLYGAIVGKIDQVVLDLSQIKIFDLWFKFLLLGQGHDFFFKFAFYVYYMMQFSAKSVKPFRIYSKIKYLTMDLCPWSDGHKICFLLIFLGFLHGAIFSTIGRGVQDLSQNEIFGNTSNIDLWPWVNVMEKRVFLVFEVNLWSKFKKNRTSHL